MSVRRWRLRSVGVLMIIVAGAVTSSSSCAPAMRNTVNTLGAPAAAASLWEEPRDLATRGC